MKIPIYIGTLICCIKFVSAQLVSVNVGPSFAVGNYANKQFYNEKASQAGMGYTVKINNEFFPGSLVSPNFFLIFNNNDMMSGEIETLFPTIDFIPQSPYRQVAGGVGVTVQTTRKKRANVGLSANVGLAKYTSSSFMLEDLKSSNYVSVKSTSVMGTMLILGCFTRIPISERVSFNVNADYMLGQADYGVIQFESKGMGYASSEGVKLPFGVISAQVGLSFNLLRYSAE